MTAQKTTSFYSRNQIKVAAGPSIQSVKYHNGFYLTPLSVAWATQLAQVNTFTCFRGLQVRYTLRTMEGAKGNYSAGFADVDSKLADLAGTNKRLVMFLEYKSGDPKDVNNAPDVVPDYMKTSAYDFGQLMTVSENPNTPSAGGKMMKLWNNNIRDRLLVAAAAYGARYNSHPNFEGIGIHESAYPTLVGTSGVDYPADNVDQSAIGLYKWLQALKAAFPNTMVYQFCNYDRPPVKWMIDGGTLGSGITSYTVPGFNQDGIAIGAPNTFINEWGLGGVDITKNPTTPQPPNVGIYDHFRANAGVIPIMPSWQRPDYIKTTLNKASLAGHVPTIQELYDFTKDSLMATHLFITPATSSSTDPVDHWQDVKDWLNANPSIRDSLTGGLNSAKPSCYASITTS